VFGLISKEQEGHELGGRNLVYRRFYLGILEVNMTAPENSDSHQGFCRQEVVGIQDADEAQGAVETQESVRTPEAVSDPLRFRDSYAGDPTSDQNRTLELTSQYLNDDTDIDTQVDEASEQLIQNIFAAHGSEQALGQWAGMRVRHPRIDEIAWEQLRNEADRIVELMGSD
jgi:hypothetical protein